MRSRHYEKKFRIRSRPYKKNFSSLWLREKFACDRGRGQLPSDPANSALARRKLISKLRMRSRPGYEKKTSAEAPKKNCPARTILTTTSRYVALATRKRSACEKKIKLRSPSLREKFRLLKQPPRLKLPGT